MEDRHTFSEPRPATGFDQPTWEVDVYRDGVSEHVFTLLVNNDTLPPRMRKKKVVWKLPDDPDAKPAFGSDEKKRLVDLFKQQKKERRKSIKHGTSSGTGSPENDPSADESLGSVYDEKLLDQVKGTVEVLAKGQIESQVGGSSPTSNGTPENPTIPDLGKEDQKKIDTRQVPPPPGLPEVPRGIQTPSTVSSRDESPSGTPPPGFSLSSFNIHENERYLNVPLSSSNIPVDLAQIFADLYYRSMSNGQYEGLLLHYAPTAVKSLSLGGAHAFCRSRTDIATQLTSLQGSLWDVNGAVAQEGYMNSVVLLTTGKALLTTSTQPLEFCHSVTLIKRPNGYQIHNDAMSLMA